MTKSNKRFACVGKRGYDTRAAANVRLRRLVNAGAAADTLTTYRCRFCRRHHVGHLRTGYSRP